MSLMLASVSNVQEAEIVFSAGVDIIDIKDSAKGALGAVECCVVEDIVSEIAGRSLISATVGDLPMQRKCLVNAVSAMAATGIDIVKVGIFAEVIPSEVLLAIGELAKNGIDIVLVFFADKSPRMDNFNNLAEAGVVGVMIDTADKTQGSLRSILCDNKLMEFITQAKSAGLMAGLAGSLQVNDIEPLLQLKPDYLGFRGALCRQGQRQLMIDVNAVCRVRAVIPMHDYHEHTTKDLMLFIN
ncbi:MAG: (5-formylfuran-3-yl)methyl phosphate synthase [Gammaproteobacteria bacterium]|nr:(5-formylfuran-3-yl)methyl phosphate synthase [Gammaproteobacteria bacterium]